MWATSALCAVLLATLQEHKSTASTVNPKPPNFLYILTDDQDYHYNTTHPRYMPGLNKYVIDVGMTLKNYFVSSPECCPSRTTFFVGRFAHNHNVTSPQPPNGAYPKFRNLSLDDDYLPGWLQGVGYSTYYLGKFLNNYSPVLDTHAPYNWTWVEPLVNYSTYMYNLPVFSKNGGPAKQYPGKYQVDILVDKAEQMINDAVKRGKPFYLQVATGAPHDAIGFGLNPDNLTDPELSFADPTPALRHRDLYKDVTLPPRANFDEADMSDKCKMYRESLPLFNESQVEQINEYYRNRLRTLKSVDEMIERLAKRLIKHGVYENTYIIYTSDNGYHIGAHRLGSGKLTPFEEDLRVPAFIKGPGIKQGSVNLQSSTVADLTATVMTLAGVPVRQDLDGRPIKLFSSTIKQPVTNAGREALPASIWGTGGDQMFLTFLRNSTSRTVRVCNTEKGLAPNPARRSLLEEDMEELDEEQHGGVEVVDGSIGSWQQAHRELVMLAAGSVNSTSPAERSTSTRYCWKMVAWCTGERDVYDLLADPFELQNLYSPYSTTDDGKRLLSRLEAVLNVANVCRGPSCVYPYKVIHGSDTKVTSLTQAMYRMYDNLYYSLPPYAYKECLDVFLDENEVSWAEDKVDEVE